MKKLFSIIFLVGLCIFMYPTARNWYSMWQARQEIQQYQATVSSKEKADYSEEWEAVYAYNRRLAEKEDPMVLSAQEKEEYESLLNIQGIGIMGYIEIPKIDVHLSIYHGIEESALQAGAGHWMGTSLPGGGENTHCVLTAHTGLVKAKMFTDIDQLEEGDTFSLTILDRTLKYEVDQILVTEPEDRSALAIEEGQDYVTLYTCYPYGVNTHRLLVRGHRIEPEKTSGNANEDAEGSIAGKMAAFSWQQWALFVLAIFIFVMLLLLWSRLRREKRHLRREKNEEEGNGT